MTINKLNQKGIDHLIQLTNLIKKGADAEESLDRLLKQAGINSLDNT